MTDPRLILFAHGSEDPRWRAPFERMERRLRDALGDDQVRLAYMEYSEPTFRQVADDSVQAGFQALRVLPLFLAGGAHMAKEVPQQVEEVRQVHPDLKMEVLPCIGEHPGFFELIGKIARDPSS
jgi:sirohydrochlorin cobaltochelatase